MAIVALYLLTIRPGQPWYGDFALYVSHARNLVEGRAYADTGYVRNPNYGFLSPASYPPVFPLLLAPVVGAFGLNLTAMKVVVIVFFGLALWAIDRALQDRLSPRQRLALIALLGLNPYFWAFTDNVFSDLPFLFFVYLGLWLIHAATAGPARTDRAGLLLGVLAGVAMYLAYGTRSIGLILMPCVLVHAWWRKRRLDAPLAAATLAVAVGAVIQSVAVRSAGQYVETMRIYLDPATALQMFGLKLVSWFNGLVELFRNGYLEPAAWVLTAAALALAVIGYVSSVRHRRSVFEVFAALYLLMVLAWPHAQDPRFLIPLLPLGLAYAFAGWQWLGGKLPAKLSRDLTAALLVVTLGGYALKASTLDLQPVRPNVIDRDARNMFKFVSDHTEPSDLIVFAKPRVLALYTRRRCIATAPGANAQQLRQFLHDAKATHLMLAGWSATGGQTLAPFISQNRPMFELAYQNESYVLFRVHLPVDAEPTAGQ